jgi:heme oxygenase
MAIALVFAMKLRDSNIHLDEDLEDFMSNIQPPITEENYSEILRRSERNVSEMADSSQSNDEEEDENENESDNDDAILATLSDETENEDEDEEENELDSTIRGRGRQVNGYLFILL